MLVLRTHRGLSVSEKWLLRTAAPRYQFRSVSSLTRLSRSLRCPQGKSATRCGTISGSGQARRATACISCFEDWSPRRPEIAVQTGSVLCSRREENAATASP